MKKFSLAVLILSSFAAFSLTGCQQAAPVKDGVCSQPVGGAALPGLIDPDCPAAAPAKR